MTETVIAAKPAKAAAGVLFGETGATLPTDTEAPLTALSACGYVSEDGLQESSEHGTEDVLAWGGDVVRTLSTDHSLKYTMTFIEAGNLNLLKLAYGAENVTSANGKVTIKKTNHLPGRKSFVFDMKDGTNKMRLVVPNGQIVLTGETNYTHGEVMSFECEITCYPDANGVKAFEYRSDAVTV